MGVKAKPKELQTPHITRTTQSPLQTVIAALGTVFLKTTNQETVGLEGNILCSVAPQPILLFSIFPYYGMLFLAMQVQM